MTSFVDIIQEAIGVHLASAANKSNGIEYDIDDQKAWEGYVQDRIVTSYYRNRPLVEQCKKRADFTCQSCGFKLRINNNYVIECHHKNPVSQNGIRLSSIEELICLCPTCHRIAHKRSNPYTIKEIMVFLKHSE